MSLEKISRPLILAATMTFAFGQPAMAYIGPGAGLSALGSILAFLGVVVLVIAGFVWYPVKRMLAKRKAAKDPSVEADEGK